MSSVKIPISNKTNKEALTEWEEFLEGIRNSTPVDQNETEKEKRERIKWLEKEGNHEEWMKYYFPKFAFAEPAKFQKESTIRVLKAKKKFYQRRAWARGLAKSTRRMMEIFYISFARKFPTNMLLISKSEENAIRLLAPYKGNLEANSRLINDYGVQERAGKWKEHEFITRSKKAFRAVGAKMNPRGAKIDELRVNIQDYDDIDDDEVCRNEERLDELWKWIEKAVIPTVDISSPYYIFFDNNIIAEDSCAVRAAEFADDVEDVPIRYEKTGKSSWPEKNSEEDIDEILRTISWESAQGEYFNNPMSNGKSFPEMKWGKCPPLSKLRFVVAYADPATSNKDKPTQKSKENNSHKAVFLMGRLGMDYYVYYGFLDTMGNAAFIDGFYAVKDYVNGKTLLYNVVENNSLQDPFFTQVLKPLAHKKGVERGNDFLGLIGDDRKKPEKWDRIEANLEPLNREGHLILNIEEKDNPHMKRLETQFKKAKATSKRLDGPDCVEGGKFIIDTKFIVSAPGAAKAVGRRTNPKRI